MYLPNGQAAATVAAMTNSGKEKSVMLLASMLVSSKLLWLGDHENQIAKGHDRGHDDANVHEEIHRLHLDLELIAQKRKAQQRAEDGQPQQQVDDFHYDLHQVHLTDDPLTESYRTQCQTGVKSGGRRIKKASSAGEVGNECRIDCDPPGSMPCTQMLLQHA